MTEDIAQRKVIVQAADDTLLSIARRYKESDDFLRYCIEQNMFYYYKEGYWKRVHDIELFDLINKHVRISHYSIAQRKNIIENLKIVTKLRLDSFNWTGEINFSNGMFNIENNLLSEHNPIFYSTIRLPYEYNPDEKCDLWIKTLNEIFEEDANKINLLQEFFGYCLSNKIDQKKALLLLGDSDTGKSTILFTLRDLLGQQNVSNVPLKFLSNPQYTPMLINKMVNIDADVDKNAANYEAEFKIITSGEPIACNQKFIETFDFIPKAKIVLAANIFPKITDHSSAFYKRLILIPCERIFDEKEKNRELPFLLRKELPGIFNWTLEGLKRLKSRKMFEQLDFMKDAVQDLENENNPVNVFFNEHVITKHGEEIEKGELYNHYVAWTKRDNVYTLSKARFSSCVYKRYSKFTPKDTNNPNTNKRIWRNIKYINGNLPEDNGWQND